MRQVLAHGIAIAAGLALCVFGVGFDLHICSLFGGAYTALTLEEAGRAALASMRPATKAERRLANSVESAVAQRSLQTNRVTGEHAAG